MHLLDVKAGPALHAEQNSNLTVGKEFDQSAAESSLESANDEQGHDQIVELPAQPRFQRKRRCTE